NVLTLYGKDKNSRLADSDDPRRIFSWLISETRDDKGNAVIYEYKSEDGEGIDLAQAHERNRGDKNCPNRKINRYLKKIKYGNRTTLLDDSGQCPRFVEQKAWENANWMFEVVFDYDEGHCPDMSPDADKCHYLEAEPDAEGRTFAQANSALPSDSHYWPVRQDPISSYRAGFEIRTYRLCRRVLMFHHFTQELRIGDCLVHSTEFSYSESPVASFMISVTQSGFVRQPTQNQDNRYLKKSLPPLEFEYSSVSSPEQLVQQPIQEVERDNLESLPVGLDGASYQWIDLDGEGTSGILTEQAGCWYYKRNLSANYQVDDNGHERTVACFGATEAVARKPMGGLAGGAQFLDLAGDGQVDLVQMEGPVRGFYERTNEATWESLRSFDSWPNISPHDPNLKFVDLTGDGHADILITESEALTWHPSLAEEGFGPAIRLSLPVDEEQGPRLVFADGTQSIYLADLSGDGLTDLARVRNGEICYWPNLGYGRFGAKITMDNAPLFDAPDQFDQQRIRLADIDGSGTTDIIYLCHNGAKVHFNQSGNCWSAPVELPQFPPIDSLTSVQVVDLLGNGTACLVWSSPLPSTSRQPMRYLALMPEKPHLLTDVKNNLGAETKIQYAPSTKFYLKDKKNGQPWVTRLPFPVHVAERVEVFDHISRNHFVTKYAYHHGYFDGAEREFRGFGMVEQWDTDEFDKLNHDASNVDYRWSMPAVHTKTWFHIGAFIEGGRISQQMAHEYFGAPQAQADFNTWVKDTLLDDTILPPITLTTEEIRQAYRALKGAMLRQEIYADDGPAKAGIPYSVSERNYTIKLVQEQADNRHAVFFTHARETIDYHYERNLTDPRVSHTLALEVDQYGNVLKSVAIGYGRKQSPLTDQPDRDKQTTSLITYTDQRVTNAIDDWALYADDYRTPPPAETRVYELTGFQLESGAVRFSFDQFARNDYATLESAEPLDYEQTTDLTKPQKRLIEDVRTLYRKDDLTGLLSLGEIQPLALPGESYKLAFTAGLLDKVYKRQRNGQPHEDLLPDRASVLEDKGGDQGGYVKLDGKWWIPSGRVFYDQTANANDPAVTAATEIGTARTHFFLPIKFVDPFDQSVLIDYDIHDMLTVKIQDTLLNTITAQLDYRVLQPWQITDPNGNRAEVAFDTLGLVVATALRGKVTENFGGRLDNFDADLVQSDIDDFHNSADPHAVARDLDLIKDADTRVIYDLHRFYRSHQASDDSATWEPPYAATLARETHASDGVPLEDLKIQISFSYSDGFGREIQKKIQAEPGEVEVENDAGTITVENTSPNLRWVGSGWTIFNNKGKPVRQYEPFFSTHHHFQYGKKVGVSPVLFYDPLERVVATLHPNNVYEKVVFDPWRQKTYDVNDTLHLPEHPGDPPFDPKDDPDAGQYFRRLPEDTYLPTWYDLRTDAAKASQAWPDARQCATEKTAAEKAVLHADTPAIAHFDPLGRALLTIADNGKDADGNALWFTTRVVLDIEGNQREVIDAKGRVVMQYDYDMLGNRIHQSSMEAGERWMLNDVTGKPIRAWDSRGFTRRMAYDELRRPIDLYVTENGAERLAERTVYGESQGNTKNHRTRVYEVFDAAGVVTNLDYDFRGNLRESRRDLLPAPAYKQIADWNQNPDPNGGTFTSHTEYDALNRPTHVTSPDGSVYHPIFNEANLLNKVDVNLRGEEENGIPKWTSFVANINYNAKGQRELIVYGNGSETTYAYDELTFRLIHLKTTRPAGRNGLAQIFANLTIVQDLYYTYDPVGNITCIWDGALPTVWHNNQEVKPISGFTYDAIYRLIEAKGREHIGQVDFDFDPPDGNYRNYLFAGLNANPNDLQALRKYTQKYMYDAVGNFESIHHVANGANWWQYYDYEEESLIDKPSETGKKSNRLTRTRLSSDNLNRDYTYDSHGNITSMSHLPTMAWDFKDQLRATTRQVVNNGTPKTTYYVYNAGGQRVWKVTENQNEQRVKERIYLGGFEVYREFNGSSGDVTLERESLHVMDDKQRIALVETQTGPVQEEPLIRYQLGNHLGSASVELDKDSALISYEEYYPYGTTSFQAGRSAAEVKLRRYRYTGKERDEESGLYYHGARYYAAWDGKWLNPDPSGIQDAVNLYQYVSGNPVRLTDPSGLGKWDRILGGLKMVGGAIEAVVGAELVVAGVATSEIGVGVLLIGAGALVAAHGADVAVSGARTMWNGTQVDTFTSQGLQAAGMSRTAANLTDAGISIVGSVGAGTATAAIKVSGIATTEPLAQGLSTPQILSRVESGSRALNNADYARLGGQATSAMAKAEMIKAGVDATRESYQLTTTAVQSFSKSLQLIPTGPTPLADIGLGVLGAAAGVSSAAQSLSSASQSSPVVPLDTSLSTSTSEVAGSKPLTPNEPVSDITVSSMSLNISVPTEGYDSLKQMCY
ncbi:MAG: toxin, partial [Chloroflexi bacterium]